MNFRQKLYRFMIGRNGPDELGKFILIFGLIIAIGNAFVRSSILYIIEYAFIIYFIFRFLSRNVVKRRAENEKYLKFSRYFRSNDIINRAKAFFKLQKDRIKDRKTHIYRKCPRCKAVLRLPNTKGEHSVSCPRCKNHFDVKVR